MDHICPGEQKGVDSKGSLVQCGNPAPSTLLEREEMGMPGLFTGRPGVRPREALGNDKEGWSIENPGQTIPRSPPPPLPENGQ